MDNAPDIKEKKIRRVRVQYVIWWRPPGGARREYGPIFDKKTAMRDALYYQNLYGGENGGWEICNPASDRPQHRDRRRY